MCIRDVDITTTCTKPLAIRLAYHIPDSVELRAESTFEAELRALKIFRQEEWCTEAVYATGYLEISVKSPVVEYKIFLEDLDRWLKQPRGSPHDTALRQKLKPIALCPARYKSLQQIGAGRFALRWRGPHVCCFPGYPKSSGLEAVIRALTVDREVA